jgi:acyl-CoA thioesterase-1
LNRPWNKQPPVVFCSLALTFACAAASSVAAHDGAAAPRIVALGDSLTAGQGIGLVKAYPAVVQEWLDEARLELTMVNAGVNGDTTSRAVARLDRALTGDVRILIIGLGANDGLRGVPIAQLKANLSRIIETAQGRGIAVLLCGMEALPVHGWDYSVAFHMAYRELAERYRVPLVPFMLTNVIGNPEMMQRDRIHPNAEGARAIAQNIWPYLKPLAESAVRAK